MVRCQTTSGGLVPGLLQDLTLAAAVQEIGVHAEGGLAALVLGDGDLVLLGELDELRAAGEVPFAPGGDDLHVRLEGVVGDLEPDLVVALAGGAVGDGVGAHLFRDLDLALGDQGAGDGGAEEVHALVECVHAEHREDEVADEFLTEVVHEDVLFLDAQELCLVAGRAEFLTLSQIGGEGDDLRPIGRLEPFQDDRGVEAARIGQHNLLHVLHTHFAAGPC